MRYLDFSECKFAVLESNARIIDAIESMNETGLGFVILCNETERGLIFVGFVQDGDLRRAIERSQDLNAKIINHANLDPGCVSSAEDLVLARDICSSRSVHIVPVINNDVFVGAFTVDASSHVSDIEALIMAGGRGERLRPLTDSVPKPLLTVGDKPILERNIEALVAAGINKITISLNYKGDMIREYFGSGSRLSADISYIREKNKMGTAGALSMIEHKMKKDVLVMNADILNTFNYYDFLERHRSEQNFVTIAMVPHNYTCPFGVIRLEPNGDYKGIDEKPIETFLVNAGAYIFNSEVVGLMELAEPIDAPELLKNLKQEQKAIGTFLHEGRWLDIGSQASLRLANNILQSKAYD